MPTFTCTVDVMAGGDETIPTLSVSFAVEVSEKHHRALLNPSTQTPALINDREDALAIVYEASQQAVVGAQLPCGACGAQGPPPYKHVRAVRRHWGDGQGDVDVDGHARVQGRPQLSRASANDDWSCSRRRLLESTRVIKRRRTSPGCWYEATTCAKCRKRDVELKK